MRLPAYVKSKKYIDFIPVIGRSTANTIYPFIFIPEIVYKNLSSEKPNPKFISLLKHEETHLKREKEMGILMFGIKYLLFPKFRFNEELIANAEEMREYKRNKLSFNHERVARSLSGPLYFWSTDYKTAKRELESAWKKIK